MFERARDFTARALLPALLLALTLPLIYLGEHRYGAMCHRLAVLRLERDVGELSPEVDELFHALSGWQDATSHFLFRHHMFLWWLTLTFALAYLLLARERRVLRIGVCATAILVPVAYSLFHNLC